MIMGFNFHYLLLSKSTESFCKLVHGSFKPKITIESESLLDTAPFNNEDF